MNGDLIPDDRTVRPARLAVVNAADDLTREVNRAAMPGWRDDPRYDPTIDDLARAIDGWRRATGRVADTPPPDVPDLAVPVSGWPVASLRDWLDRLPPDALVQLHLHPGTASLTVHGSGGW